MNKKLIGIMMAVCLCSTPIWANEIKNEKVPTIAICPPMLGPVMINGQSFYFPDAYPEQYTIMVPIREAAEALGFQVKWEPKEQVIHLDNGKVKTTLKVGQNSYFLESSQAIGLTQAKPLAAPPTMRNNKTYVPVEIFNLLFSNPEAVQKPEIPGVKITTVEVGGKEHSLSVKLPYYISEYVTLEKVDISFNQEGSYPIVLLKFQNKDKIANIGHFSVLTTEQFNLIQAEEGPKELEVYRNDEMGVVITFVGLFDMPFEMDTLEADLVGQYHSELTTILKSIKFE